ncbi:MAG: hypothetical protein QHC67_02965 [Sphingobium sp.]|uniref:hypothetical protein n=1 Tax=Sphingobium sp. TaxID=1912891 RepID=UPI0029A2273E|nr:hypothetical protein [Sphingobium sp.]MDX3908759.1 hypothetical protein [Sphingobium sp.]
MKIIYVRKPNLYLALSDTFDVRLIQRNTVREINPHAVQVEEMDAVLHSDRKGIRNDTLHIDGWGLVEVADWLFTDRPGLTVNQFGNAFMRLFKEGTCYLIETLKASCRAMVPELEAQAAGEQSYFLGLVRSQHPAEFSELREAWLNR